MGIRIFKKRSRSSLRRIHDRISHPGQRRISTRSYSHAGGVAQSFGSPGPRPMTPAMIARQHDAALSSADDERRSELRTFLLTRRSRLKPDDVGLPQTGRRRVDGLRREEVAELAGVSTDWYRWFEGGRVVRVSTAFLARLSGALRLNPSDRIALFYLALPEVYEAYASEPRLRPYVLHDEQGDESRNGRPAQAQA